MAEERLALCAEWKAFIPEVGVGFSTGDRVGSVGSGSIGLA